MVRRRLAAVLAALILGAGLGVANAPAAQAVPFAGDLDIFENAWYGNPVIHRFHLNYGTCDSISGYQFWLTTSWPGGEARHISSSRFWPRTAHTGCNRMGVESMDGPRWSKCINVNDNGINWYGQGYNDWTRMVYVLHDPGCPSW